MGSGPPRLFRNLPGAALAALWLTGCAMANNVAPNLPHVFAMRGCTQEDAPALEIYVTAEKFDGNGEPAPPYLKFEIASAPAEAIAPQTHRLMPLRRDSNEPRRIVRGQWVEVGHAPIWLAGTVSLTTAGIGQHASGRYDVTAPDGRHFSAAFSAPYSDKSAVCG